MDIHYKQRMAELSEQFAIHKKTHSWRSASYRLRKMARLMAEHTGKTYDSALQVLMRLHNFTQMTN